jgi:hypothetical protein
MRKEKKKNHYIFLPPIVHQAHCGDNTIVPKSDAGRQSAKRKEGYKAVVKIINSSQTA